MDADKWKSVVISIAAYNKLKDLAKKNHRTISGQFTYLLEKALVEKL